MSTTIVVIDVFAPVRLFFCNCFFKRREISLLLLSHVFNRILDFSCVICYIKDDGYGFVLRRDEGDIRVMRKPTAWLVHRFIL